MRSGVGLKVFLFAFVVTVLIGCNRKEKPMASKPEVPTDSPNRTLSDEVNQAQDWLYAKKTRPIGVRRLNAAQTVKTLEGEEQDAAGHYLCKGEAGDIWPQTEQNL